MQKEKEASLKKRAELKLQGKNLKSQLALAKK